MTTDAGSVCTVVSATKTTLSCVFATFLGADEAVETVKFARTEATKDAVGGVATWTSPLTATQITLAAASTNTAESVSPNVLSPV